MDAASLLSQDDDEFTSNPVWDGFDGVALDDIARNSELRGDNNHDILSQLPLPVPATSFMKAPLTSGQTLAELADSVSSADLPIHMSSSGVMSVDSHSQAVMCVQGCSTLANDLGGKGGSKGAWRYGYHCPVCNFRWTQLRPEDVGPDGDAQVKKSNLTLKTEIPCRIIKCFLCHKRKRPRDDEPGCKCTKEEVQTARDKMKGTVSPDEACRLATAATTAAAQAEAAHAIRFAEAVTTAASTITGPMRPSEVLAQRCPPIASQTITLPTVAKPAADSPAIVDAKPVLPTAAKPSAVAPTVAKPAAAPRKLPSSVAHGSQRHIHGGKPLSMYLQSSGNTKRGRVKVSRFDADSFQTSSTYAGDEIKEAFACSDGDDSESDDGDNDDAQVETTTSVAFKFDYTIRCSGCAKVLQDNDKTMLEPIHYCDRKQCPSQLCTSCRGFASDQAAYNYFGARKTKLCPEHDRGYKKPVFCQHESCSAMLDDCTGNLCVPSVGCSEDGCGYWECYHHSFETVDAALDSSDWFCQSHRTRSGYCCDHPCCNEMIEDADGNVIKPNVGCDICGNYWACVTHHYKSVAAAKRAKQFVCPACE